MSAEKLNHQEIQAAPETGFDLTAEQITKTENICQNYGFQSEELEAIRDHLLDSADEFDRDGNEQLGPIEFSTFTASCDQMVQIINNMQPNGLEKWKNVVRVTENADFINNVEKFYT